MASGMSGPAGEIDDVLDFWFGPEPGMRLEVWFRRNDAFDAEIRERFGALHARALAGGCDHWAGTPRGALALIIVLDQFSRNLFRGDPRTYAGDAKALAVARDALAKGWDRDLAEVERVFLYLPFEHSEALEDQKRSVALFAGLGEKAAEAAERHLWLIERFGRFPHRNAVLGRENTPEEAEYLAGPREGFEAG